MRIGTSDLRSLPFPVTFLRVERGGTLRVRLTSGRDAVFTVSDGSTLNQALTRIYTTGTTARGFSTSVVAVNADLEAELEYRPIPESPLRDGEGADELTLNVDVDNTCVGFYLEDGGTVTYLPRAEGTPKTIQDVPAGYILRVSIQKVTAATGAVFGIFAGGGGDAGPVLRTLTSLTAEQTGDTINLTWDAGTEEGGDNHAPYLVDFQINLDGGGYGAIPDDPITGTEPADEEALYPQASDDFTLGQTVQFRARRGDGSGNYSEWEESNTVVIAPVVLSSDNFNRANGAVGGSWTDNDNAWTISSNHLVPPTGFPSPPDAAHPLVRDGVVNYADGRNAVIKWTQVSNGVVGPVYHVRSNADLTEGIGIYLGPGNANGLRFGSIGAGVSTGGFNYPPNATEAAGQTFDLRIWLCNTATVVSLHEPDVDVPYFAATMADVWEGLAGGVFGTPDPDCPYLTNSVVGLSAFQSVAVDDYVQEVAPYDSALICAGTSIMQLCGNTPQPLLGLGWKVWNHSVPSQSLADVIATQFPNFAGPRIAAELNAGKRVAFLFDGATNDLFSGASVATCISRRNTVVGMAQALGDVRVLVATTPPRSDSGTPVDFEANRLAFNADCIANAETLGFEIVGWGELSNMQDPTNTGSFGDLVHPTPFGRWQFAQETASVVA